jgi:uncharacterized protein YlxW (UPF0749 family)
MRMIVMSFLPMISSSTLELIIAGVVLITILNLVLVIVAMSLHSSLRKKMKKWKSIHASADLESVYRQTLDAVNELRDEMKTFGNKITAVEEDMQNKVDTPIMRRFNAFAETGSDLSYSVAFLDGNKNGVVLTSIYSRQDSHTYGKPIFKGRSEYPLTDEEKIVIDDTSSGIKQHSAIHVG